MSKIQDTWTKASATLGAFSPFYQEGMLRLVRDHNAPNNWFTLTQVRSTEPKPFRAADLQAGNPYASPDRYRERLDALTEAGVLEKVAGGYCLNEKGRAIVEGFYSMAHENLKDVKPLSDDELDDIAELLGRIVHTTDDLPAPAAKPNFAFSRWSDPGDDALAVLRIDQYATDLTRYRDDAHIGAWHPHNVSGPAWEALTYIWREDDVNTPDALAERLNRGYTADDYQAALNELVNKGWVKAENGHFEVTEKGAAVRETAEAETDRLFYQGWAALSDAEVDRLDGLLESLNKSLNDMALVEMWPLANSVSAAINPLTRDVVTPAFNEIFGENNGRFFFVTLQIAGVAPKALRAEDFSVRLPYANIIQRRQNLKDAAEAGFLNNHGDSTFTITEKGKKAVEAINGVFYGALGELEDLPEDTIKQLEGLLDKLVQASLKAEKPADKSALLLSNKSHTHPNAAPLAQIDQHLDDLNAFRDVSHIAAWRGQQEIHGRTWEAFAFVADGKAHSAATLLESLPNRGYSEEDYAASLAELVELDWIETGEEGYQVTEKGRKVRQTAEDKTNEYFYTPWSVLEGNELNQLRFGLMRLKVILEGLAEATPS
jgi:predicted transcriptional regulator